MSAGHHYQYTYPRYVEMHTFERGTVIWLSHSLSLCFAVHCATVFLGPHNEFQIDYVFVGFDSYQSINTFALSRYLQRNEGIEMRDALPDTH